MHIFGGTYVETMMSVRPEIQSLGLSTYQTHGGMPDTNCLKSRRLIMVTWCHPDTILQLWKSWCVPGHLWVTGLPRNAFQFDWFSPRRGWHQPTSIYKCTCQMSKETTWNNESDESELKRKKELNTSESDCNCTAPCVPIVKQKLYKQFSAYQQTWSAGMRGQLFLQISRRKLPLKMQNVSRSKTNRSWAAGAAPREDIHKRNNQITHDHTSQMSASQESTIGIEALGWQLLWRGKLIMIETNAAQVLVLHLKTQSNALQATPGKVSHGKSKYNHVHNRHQ